MLHRYSTLTAAAASIKIGNVGMLFAKGAGCYANWRRYLRQKAELCTPIGGDVYAICRKHAAPMGEALCEAHLRRPNPRGNDVESAWCQGEQIESRGMKSKKYQKRYSRYCQRVTPNTQRSL